MPEHGAAPFTVAVLHGGPGLPGSVRSLARRVGERHGTLEPPQRADSLDGQVAELAAELDEAAEVPVRLVGWSWGAMLGYLVAARRPELVSRLIMVGSGVFDDGAAASISATRRGRLAEKERRELERLEQELSAPTPDEAAARRYAALIQRADAFDPITNDAELDAFEPEVNQRVWSDVRELRRSGELLALGGAIRCPVVALHGDHDPHPAAAVRGPLARVLPDFRFVLLERCGHVPWIERQAAERFYELLEAELASRASSSSRRFA